MSFNRLEVVGRVVGTGGLAAAGWAIGTRLTDGFAGSSTDLAITTVLIAAGALLGAALTPYLTNRPLVALADYLIGLPYPTLSSIVLGLVVGVGLAHADGLPHEPIARPGGNRDPRSPRLHPRFSGCLRPR